MNPLVYTMPLISAYFGPKGHLWMVTVISTVVSLSVWALSNIMNFELNFQINIPKIGCKMS